MSSSSKDGDRPVNLADIAEAVGVSMMTVSLALRDHQRISPKTKARVIAKAEELGYVRDPELSRLMAYIRNRRSKNLQANLGFLHCLQVNFNKDAGQYMWSLYESAKQQAAEMGYSLNTIWLTEKGMSERRMSQIIETRNIQGIVVAPIPSELGFQPGERMDPSKVAGVTIGYSVTNPRYSRVTFNHYQAIQLAMNKLCAMGYKRIGLALDAVASTRVRDLWLAGFAAWQNVNLKSIRVSPLIIESDWEDAMQDWLKKRKPDVILTQTENTHRTLTKLGYKVPADIGIAYLNANFHKEQVAGIVQNTALEGQLAIEYLVSQILARRIGVPESNVTIMVKGSWRLGTTLLPARK